MPQLTPIKLEDGTFIYIESSEDVNAVEIYESAETEETLIAKGGMESALKKFRSIEDTIRAYTSHTLNAFRDLAAVNVDKVTLEFGVKIGGQAGIPYITKGTAESNLKIRVECSFSERRTKGE